VLLKTNFIPHRLEQRRRTARLARYGLWLTVLAAVVAIAPALLLQGLAAHRGVELRATAKRRDIQAAPAEEVRWREAELRRLQPARGVVRAAHANNARGLGLLEELRDRMPEGAWLTQLSVAPPTVDPGGSTASSGRPQVVILAGRASGHEPIGELLVALNRSAWVRHAVLSASHPVTPPATTVGSEAGTDAAATAAPDDGAKVAFEVRAVLAWEIPEG
jgi:Tfp pilus assembly protein PilN